ncbi:methyl-accepting chemotaxis protein [Massilia solisilvae]|uniref:methyl-accepting chemotaxis protein n=1 Tax=Massilia solisilvae TaxID=1811225 RepID=UPI0027D9B3FB|nr:methyl-accepting chemotaxis protein [Massilia solisilvae]
MIDAFAMESSARQPLATVLRAVQATQQHRGLAALVLGGVPEATRQREEKQRQIDQLYLALDGQVREINDAAITVAWTAARKDWDSLRERLAARSISVPDSFAAHTALISKLLTAEDEIADHFGLNLDPDLDTYQLVQTAYYNLPYLSEELGKMRAKGAGLLAARSASAEERLALSSIVARASDRLNQTIREFDKSAHANPAIKEKLVGPLQDLSARANEAMQLATGQIVKPETLAYSGQDYVRQVTAAIDVQYAFTDAAIAQFDQLLGQKIDSRKRQAVLMLVALAAMVALGGALMFLIARSVTRPLGNAVEIAERVASGDLTTQFDVKGRNETARLLHALAKMNGNLRRMVGEVRHSVDTIGAATSDIAGGNANLAARTEAQAASLEQTASAMEEMTATVAQNADSAQRANALAADASDIALKGGQVVTDVVQTMGAIHDSASRVADIIGVIDGIAFQTNILALNAAVEAARAGEQGRGFAVVAAEVRTLAQRSAGAAKEIKQLIDESVGRVETGNRLVEQAGALMQDVVASIGQVSAVVGEIVTASGEQSAGIHQINDTLTHLDEATQQNATLVEEAAAAAASLNEQAQSLVRSMGVFTLSARNVAAGGSASAPRLRPALRAA